MKKFSQWKKDRYEQVVSLIYDGYTAGAVNDKLGLHVSGASYGLNAVKLSASNIRYQKKLGVPLTEILSQISWGFLEERKEMRKKKARIAIAAKEAKRPVVTTELSELLTMVRELHAAWFPKPEKTYANGSLKEVARQTLERLANH